MHAVHVYRGSLSDAVSIPEYVSQEHLGDNTLLLHNVNDVQVRMAGQTEGIGSRDFEEIILKDAKVLRSWELNGKTYGILKGSLIGKHKMPLAVTPSPPKPPVKAPDPPDTDPGGKVGGNGEGDGGGGGNGSSNGGDGSNGSTNGGGNVGGSDDNGTGVRIPPPPSPPPTPPRRGCLPSMDGCLGRLWNILKWLLLLLLLFLLISWLLDRCKKPLIPPVETKCCSQRDSLQKIVDTLQLQLEEQRREQDVTDSLQKELDRRRKRDSAQSGEITVSLYWEGTDDMDLALEQPNGKMIYYDNKKDLLHGAELDVDANSQRSEITDQPIENIYINQPMSGQYRVYVSWFQNRMGHSELPYFLSLKVGDQTKIIQATAYGISKGIIKTNWPLVYEFQY